MQSRNRRSRRHYLEVRWRVDRIGSCGFNRFSPVDANLQTQLVDVIGNGFDATRKPGQIDLLAAFLVSLKSLPSSIHENVIVAQGSQPRFDNGVGSGFNDAFIDDGLEAVPRIPTWQKI